VLLMVGEYLGTACFYDYGKPQVRYGCQMSVTNAEKLQENDRQIIKGVAVDKGSVVAAGEPLRRMSSLIALL